MQNGNFLLTFFWNRIEKRREFSYIIWKKKYFMILKRKWGDKILNEIAKGNADRWSCLVYQNINFLWIQLMKIMSNMRNTFIQYSHKNLHHHHHHFLSQKLQWTFLISFPSYALLLQYVNDSSSVFLFCFLLLVLLLKAEFIHLSWLHACILYFKLDSGGSFSDFHFQSDS